METKQTQINTFDAGLNTDLHPLTTPNNTLTDCVNGTILTHNGNEYILQNDIGNIKVDGGNLKPGYIPIGMKAHDGVLYIVSYNPIEKRSEFGSIPSLAVDKNIKKTIIKTDIPSLDRNIEYNSFIPINIDFGDVSYNEIIQITNEEGLDINNLNNYLISSLYIIDNSGNEIDINVPISSEYKVTNNVKVPETGKLYGKLELPKISILNFEVYYPEEFNSDNPTVIVIKGKFDKWVGLETNIELELEYFFNYFDYQYSDEEEKPITIILDVDKNGLISGTSCISSFNNPKTRGRYELKSTKTIKLFTNNNYIKYEDEFIEPANVKYISMTSSNNLDNGDMRYIVQNNNIIFRFNFRSMNMVPPGWDQNSRWYLEASLFGGNAEFTSSDNVILNQIGSNVKSEGLLQTLLVDGDGYADIVVPLNTVTYKNSIIILSWKGYCKYWYKLSSGWSSNTINTRSDNIFIFVGENFQSNKNMYNLTLEDIGNYIYNKYEFNKSVNLQVDNNNYEWEYFNNTSNWNKLTLKDFSNDYCIKNNKWFWPAYGTTTTIQANLILDDINKLKTEFYNILHDGSLMSNSLIDVNYNNYSGSTFNIKNNQKLSLPLYNIKTIPLIYSEYISPLYNRSYLINKYKTEENNLKYNSYIFEFIGNKLIYSKYINGSQKILFDDNILWYGNWDSSEVSLYKDNLGNYCIHLGNSSEISGTIISTHINHNEIPFIQYLLSIDLLSLNEILTNFENFTWTDIQSEPVIFLVKSDKDLILNTNIVSENDNDYNLFITVPSIDSLEHKYNIISSYIMKNGDNELTTYNIGKFNNINSGVNIGYNVLNLILEHTYKTGDLISEGSLYLYSPQDNDTLIVPNSTKLNINSIITLGLLKVFGVSIENLVNCTVNLNTNKVKLNWIDLLGTYSFNDFNSSIDITYSPTDFDFSGNVLDNFDEIVNLSKTYVDNTDNNKLYNDFSEIKILSINNRQSKITDNSLKLLSEISDRNKELIDNLSANDIQYKVENIEDLVSSKIGDMELLKLNNTNSYVIPDFTIETESGESCNIMIDNNIHLLSDQLLLSSDDLKDIIYGN